MNDDWLPPLPDELPRVLARSELARFGVTRAALEHKLRTQQWRMLLPRTCLTSDTVTWFDKQRAALAFAGGGAVLSGAAALDGLGLKGVRRPSTILVLVPRSSRVRSTGFVQIRPTARLPRPDLRPGPACAPVARAVADLAHGMRRLDGVRALVADAVRLGLCTADEMQIEVDAGQRNGSAHLRAAVEEVSGGAWSAAEARAGRLLRAAGLGPFVQNFVVKLAGANELIVDFYWPHLRAVLEIDSDEFHDLPPDADRTDERHLLLSTLGYSVVHRRPAYIQRHPEEFVAGIDAWLAARAVELRVARC